MKIIALNEWTNVWINKPKPLLLEMKIIHIVERMRNSRVAFPFSFAREAEPLTCYLIRFPDLGFHAFSFGENLRHERSRVIR
jgi:hypothetical protein